MLVYFLHTLVSFSLIGVIWLIFHMLLSETLNLLQRIYQSIVVVPQYRAIIFCKKKLKLVYQMLYIPKEFSMQSVVDAMSSNAYC